MPESIEIILSEAELRELYVQLKRQESQLGNTLQHLLFRIEKSLYERLTIEDIERLKSSFEVL